MIVNSWAELIDAPISTTAIRNLHPAEEGFRIFPNSYSAGVGFPVHIAIPCRVYVLAGKCSYKIDQNSALVDGGCYIDLEAGGYKFEVDKEGPVEIVKVFRIPQK